MSSLRNGPDLAPALLASINYVREKQRQEREQELQFTVPTVTDEELEQMHADLDRLICAWARRARG